MKERLIIEMIKTGLGMEVLNKVVLLSDKVIIVNLKDGSKGIITTKRVA